MFFPFYGLSTEQVSKIFKTIQENNEKEALRKKEELKKEQIRKMLNTNPPTTLSGMIGYSYLLQNLNKK
jgi:hypothetical protein